MRNFITVPCNMYFTIEQKVKRFLETTFLVYRISEEKIKEAILFVSKYDFEHIAQDVISSMLNYLKEKV